MAFDTVDHRILIRRLSAHFGIGNKVFDWFVSYLSHCTQYVKVNDTSSHSLPLTQGVPQGSVLGLMLYSLHTSPLGVITKHHQMNFLLYAGDTQLYISLKTCCTNDMEPSKTFNHIKSAQQASSNYMYITNLQDHCIRLPKNLLTKAMFNIKAYGGRSFVLTSAVFWKDLPESTNVLQSVETYKQKLKRHLFFQAYSGL